ncbi:hypothetical protein F5Y19DRAFT_330260 [Xylariaceae sp. FL1651]|nr:hypothetical protein F5Y19DRAFT_330260 [Xylariaceae sp. FL1651]
MNPYSCPQGFKISTQQDIDASATGLEQCTGNDVFINIISPTTQLVFPPGLLVNNISITNPQTNSLDSLHLNLNATDIVNDLYVEDFYDGSIVLPIQVDPRNGTVRSIALTTRQQIQLSTIQIDVYGNGTSNWKQVNTRKSTLRDITRLSILQLQNSTLFSSTLKFVEDLEIDNGGLAVSELSYIGNNATFTSFNVPSIASQPLQVGSNLTAQHKINDDDEDLTGYVWGIQSVGGNFAIQDWSNATLPLSTLTTVGKQLLIYDSSNSTFIFSALTSVGNLTMQNNGESLLPGDFRNLEFADSIQLKGRMDTSSLGNIFPSLKFVKQSITIEASNDDFNCSHLAFQQSQGLIGQLICNGLDTDNPNKSPPSSATRSGISWGVWVSIGVTIAITVLSNP